MKSIMYLLIVGMMFTNLTSCLDADAIQAREEMERKANAPIVKATTPDNLGKINKLSVAEFKAAIDSKKGLLIDVRTPEEFTKGHLEGAINVNFKKRTFPSYISAVPMDKPVLIYCRSGNRSGKAAFIMQSLGFKEVNDLAPGFKGWNAEKMTVVTTDNDANMKLQKSLKENAPEPKALAHLGGGTDIEVDDFEKMMKKGEVTLVDVRTPKEFAEGHLNGSINVDWKNRHFAKNIVNEVTNDKPVMIYCRSGNRSTRAMYAMRALGFKNVYNLNHGFKSWKAAGKEIKTLEVKGDIRHLDVENFNNAILGHEGILVDVRTPKEFEASHIKGSINVDYKNSNFKSEVAKMDKKTPLLIYCRSGKRSGRAVKILEGMGYKVYNLQNGFIDWKSKGGKIEGKNIHAATGGEEGC